MLKKKILKIFFIMIMFLIIFTPNAFAKSYHFKGFASQQVMDESGAWGTGIMNYMVKSMQKLEYNNYYGTNSYHTTSSKQDVLNYISMKGNNYGLSILAHGNQTGITMGDSNQFIYANDISGIWHLVLIHSCSTFYNNTYASAFQTVGYPHRAAIGFKDKVTHSDGYYFWMVFHEYVGTTSLDAVVNIGKDLSEVPVVLWGDGSWNGYAWY